VEVTSVGCSDFIWPHKVDDLKPKRLDFATKQPTFDLQSTRPQRFYCPSLGVCSSSTTLLSVIRWTTLINKKLSCRREVVRRSMSLKILPPFKVAHGSKVHRWAAVCYLLLVFDCDYVAILYRFWYNQRRINVSLPKLFGVFDVE